MSYSTNKLTFRKLFPPENEGDGAGPNLVPSPVPTALLLVYFILHEDANRH